MSGVFLGEEKVATRGLCQHSHSAELQQGGKIPGLGQRGNRFELQSILSIAPIQWSGKPRLLVKHRWWFNTGVFHGEPIKCRCDYHSFVMYGQELCAFGLILLLLR